MNFRFLSFCFLSLVLLGTAQAQKRQLTINEAINGYHLYPAQPGQLSWLPGGEKWSMVHPENKEVIQVYRLDRTNNGNVTELSLDQLNAGLSAIEMDTLRRVPRIRWIDEYHFEFSSGEQVLKAHYETGNVSVLHPNPGRGVDYSPDRTKGVKITENGFKVIDIKTGGELATIEDDQEGIVIGKAVHRYEFGITKGIFWSPDNHKIAYYRMDESMVPEYPLYRLSDTPASAEMIRYPTAGGVSHHVDLVVLDLSTGEQTTMKVDGPKDQYLTNISWHPSNQQVYIAVVNRGQNHMKLNAYDVQSGNLVKTLFEEKNSRYVEPEHPADFISEDQFIWWSERDGYNHLYLYNDKGELIKQLTKGDWVVTDFHGLTPDKKYLYITGTADSPTERHVYRVSMKSGKIKRVTDQFATHTVYFNDQMSHFLDRSSSINDPTSLKLMSATGGNLGNMYQATNPLDTFATGKIELGSIINEEGVELHYRVFKPSNFDPNKKYPAIVYLYNGPHLQLVRNTWLGGANMWYHYMASKGYVVFSIDGRGSADRGFDFESSIHRQAGTLEMKDQITGLKWLKSRPWVDESRLGIHGWSYGGFMTISLKTRHPELFKVAVAGGPVIDWRFYEVMYTERYMDTPQENPAGYDSANLMNYTQNIQPHLLVIHGAQDDVVLWQHSLLYLQKAIREGKQLDYFVYPHHPHNVRGKDRSHLYEMISNYFFEHL
jgi:dipeptidyl-peptidase-4